MIIWPWYKIFWAWKRAKKVLKLILLSSPYFNSLPCSLSVPKLWDSFSVKVIVVFVLSKPVLLKFNIFTLKRTSWRNSKIPPNFQSSPLVKIKLSWLTLESEASAGWRGEHLEMLPHSSQLAMSLPYSLYRGECRLHTNLCLIDTYSYFFLLLKDQIRLLGNCLALSSFT